jgi:glucan biosynthesis protein C
VAAFVILIVYHSSVAFFPDLSWLMKSAETSPPSQSQKRHPDLA